jgi:hypothetical protein
MTAGGVRDPHCHQFNKAGARRVKNHLLQAPKCQLPFRTCYMPVALQSNFTGSREAVLFNFAHLFRAIFQVFWIA